MRGEKCQCLRSAGTKVSGLVQDHSALLSPPSGPRPYQSAPPTSSPCAPTPASSSHTPKGLMALLQYHQLLVAPDCPHLEQLMCGCYRTSAELSWAMAMPCAEVGTSHLFLRIPCWPLHSPLPSSAEVWELWEVNRD